jgi:hypothetical protein
MSMMKSVFQKLFDHSKTATAALSLVVAFQNVAFGQRLTNTSNGNLSAVVSFTVTPGTSTMPIKRDVQFRVRSNNGTGYRVEVTSATFTNSAGVPNGGATIGASAVGVGITSINTSANNVIQPRTDVIASGFNYDPSTVPGTNGLTPYGGMGSGQATLQDLVNNPGLKILNGPRIAPGEGLNNNNFIAVTLTLALLPQYFTPDTFNAVVLLTMKDGQ